MKTDETPKEYLLTEREVADLSRLQRRAESSQIDLKRRMSEIAERLDPPFYPVSFDLPNRKLVPSGSSPPVPRPARLTVVKPK